MEKDKRILSEITVYNKYARYLPEENRRETWDELVDRNIEMHKKKYPMVEEEIQNVYDKFVRPKKLLPSMRSLQFGGKAIEVTNARIFNCAFLPINSIRSFAETMYLLLNGCGVGYSVQNFNIEKIPAIVKPNPNRNRKFLVQDDIIGWADAVRALMKSYTGRTTSTLRFDYSAIREKGALLVTSGGKAPGAAPLKIAITNIEAILSGIPEGGKLTSVDAHDICCHIADAVLSGGIRRAALLSLFDKDDHGMISSKSGNWWETNPQRGRANNSIALVRNTVSEEEFINIWKKVEMSGSGEPGFYFTDNEYHGTNPCKPLRSTILTEGGYITFKEALGRESLMVYTPSGKLVKATKPFKTGSDREVFKITLSNGVALFGTENHQHMMSSGEWKRVDEMSIGDKISYRGELEKSDSKKVSIGRDYVTVESITLDSVEDVYDITVDDESHAFIDSGVVSHNCCEIALKPHGFCNLTELNGALITTQEEFDAVAKAGAFIGTLQAGYTDFHYLNDEWKKNAEEEALLGVSITGIANENLLKLDFKQASAETVKENKRVANLIGINTARRITCVKPAGTTSLVLGTSSGIHAWHNDYYIRRMRVGKSESLYTYLKENHPDMVEDEVFNPTTTAVISVPQKAPEGAITRHEDVFDLLERVKKVSNEWVQGGHIEGDNSHNVSCTISIKDDEWRSVGEWMWKNKAEYNGISVLPYHGGTYAQTPFEDCTKEEYDRLMKSLSDVDLSGIREEEDNTDLKANLACSGSSCEIT